MLERRHFGVYLIVLRGEQIRLKFTKLISKLFEDFDSLFRFLRFSFVA